MEEGNKFFCRCQFCQEEISINKKEFNEKQFTCPSCQLISAVGKDVRKESQHKKHGGTPSEKRIVPASNDDQAGLVKFLLSCLGYVGLIALSIGLGLFVLFIFCMTVVARGH